MPVVTISGQVASGVIEVARLTADLLGAAYVDREILAEVAQRAGAPPETLASRDERLNTLGQRIANTLRRMLEAQAAAGMVGDVFVESSGVPVLLGRTYEEAAATAFTRSEEVSDAQYFALLQSVIKDLAALGNIVIVGRGGQFILHDHPEALHVRVIAPLEVRVERLVQAEGLEPREAEKQLRQADQYQAAFFRKFFRSDVQDAMRYDIVLNTAKIPYEHAAATLADLAQLVVAH
ncbi:MAG: cytidylate kinase-like family protein [Chloroflexi bacterium]|nr:cytidylate kinase-like family protein [Chloroflexota bacterium]